MLGPHSLFIVERITSRAETNMWRGREENENENKKIKNTTVTISYVDTNSDTDNAFTYSNTHRHTDTQTHRHTHKHTHTQYRPDEVLISRSYSGTGPRNASVHPFIEVYIHV